MDIFRHGFEPIAQSILDLQKRAGSVWVSLDVDSIDREYAPATLMATPGGLTRREIIHLAKFIGKMCKVIGLDIVELAPKLDENGKTGQLVIELIASLLGSEYGWYTKYMKDAAKKMK